MMLEYNILWFEDSEDYVNSFEPLISEYLKDLGFNLNLTVRPDDSDLVKIIEYEEIDLILVDQNLRKGNRGDNLIDTIRKNEMYIEIVFYSQYHNFRDDIIEQLEGVFYTEREKLLEKTKKIINLTIKKNQDVNNIRGLFIAETIYTAGQMEEIISKILKLDGDLLEFFKDQIVQDEFFTDMAKFKTIRRFIKQKIKSINQKIQSSAEEEREKLSSLKTELEEADNLFKKFQKEVIELRNELAHAKKSPDKRNTLIVRNKKRGRYEEKLFNENKCKKTREIFLKHSKNLEKMAILLDTEI